MGPATLWTMYLPDAFRVDDRAALLAHAAAHPFATLVTHGADGPAAGHLPLLVDGERNVLRGHLARANPQLSHLASGVGVLAIFHGPHAYVSPSAYTQHPSVPTWNYVVVHALGRPRIVGDIELRAMLDDMVTRFDRTGWRFEAPADYEQRMLGAIAGFEVEIASLEGKWKLSQNRPREDRERVAESLAAGDEDSRAVADLMRRLLLAG